MPSYGDFAGELYRTGIISDPWIDGRERFLLRGQILSPQDAEALETAAERIAYLHHELAEIVLANPQFLDDYFGLTPFQKVMWLSSEGRWHGIARVDLFICQDGRIRACEMNSDTPSGEAESVIVNRLLHEHHPDTFDPNAGMQEKFVSMLEGLHGSAPKTAAVIYPTDLPEDLSMIALYKEWLATRGCRLFFGSPFNLRFDSNGHVFVLDERIELIIRHYKTDWWGERETVWSDQPEFSDAEPLDAQLIPLLRAESEGAVTIVNPFGSVLSQNKFCFAFMWDHSKMFSADSQEWIRDYIPETRRMDADTIRDLRREEWVAKSVYGCEGDSVICGPFATDREWRVALEKIIMRHWILQRFFDVKPVENGLLPNFGVYVIGGRAAGFYTRLSRENTDYRSLTTPTYIEKKRLETQEFVL